MSYTQSFIVAVDSERQGHEVAEYLQSWIVDEVQEKNAHRSGHSHEVILTLMGKKRQLQDAAKYLSEKYAFDALPMHRNDI